MVTHHTYISNLTCECILYVFFNFRDGALGQGTMSLQKAMIAAANFCRKEFSEVEITCTMYVCTVCMCVCMYEGLFIHD